MLKAVFKLDLHDDKEKRAAMKIISGFAGVDSIDINMKEKKLTVCGAMDPVELVEKLRKQFPTEIVSVGPAKRTHPPPLYNYGRYVNVLNDPDIFIVSTNLLSM